MNHPDTLWNIEYHENPRLPKTDTIQMPTISFWEALVEVHVAMAQVNNNLKPKPDEVTSQPWQWPIDYSGQVLPVEMAQLNCSPYFVFLSPRFSPVGANRTTACTCWATPSFTGAIWCALRYCCWWRWWWQYCISAVCR